MGQAHLGGRRAPTLVVRSVGGRPFALQNARHAAGQGCEARVTERMAGMPPTPWNCTRGDGDHQRYGRGHLMAQAVQGDERNPTEPAAATAGGNSR